MFAVVIANWVGLLVGCALFAGGVRASKSALKDGRPFVITGGILLSVCLITDQILVHFLTGIGIGNH